MGVREQIIEAFSCTPPPDDQRVAVDTYDDEDTTNHFRGTTWQQHSAYELRRHESSLSFFTPQAFRYFLPAYMLAELDDPEIADVIAEGIAFHITRSPAEKLHHFSVAEMLAVIAFFQERASRYGPGIYQSVFDGAAETVQSAIARKGRQ